MDIAKQKILKYIERELVKDPITLTFSSPRITGARPFAVLPERSGHEVNSSDGSPFSPPSPARNAAEDTETDENLSPKELSRLAKAEEKERKRNEKAYEKMRRDIQKRGFDTALLRELDDPADIYSLSDDDIRQIEAAGLINGDGYYTFTYPEDFADIKREKPEKKTILLFSGFGAVTLILFVILINNLLAIF